MGDKNRWNHYVMTQDKRFRLGKKNHHLLQLPGEPRIRLHHLLQPSWGGCEGDRRGIRGPPHGDVPPPLTTGHQVLCFGPNGQSGWSPPCDLRLLRLWPGNRRARHLHGGPHQLPQDRGRLRSRGGSRWKGRPGKRHIRQRVQRRRLYEEVLRHYHLPAGVRLRGESPKGEVLLDSFGLSGT